MPGDTLEADALLLKLKTWFRADRDHSREWRKEAKEDFDFFSGEQWSAEDKEKLKSELRPIITFNRAQTIINSVSGQEMSSKNEVRYLPREEGDAKPNEILTEGARWFRDLAEADDEDSDAFQNAVICGMGWTDTTLDYDQEDDGLPKMDSVNPLEMVWDRGARKKNLIDAERVFRARKIALSKAKRLFPDATQSELNAGWADIDTDSAKPEVPDAPHNRYDGDGVEGPVNDDRQVTLVHAQWVEYEPFHTVIDWAGQQSEMDAGKFAIMSKRAKAANLPFYATKSERRVIKDAFIGSKVLQEGNALCKEHFRYQCITAYQDKNKGAFFGLMKSMKDPQRWANRWLLQIHDIMNSQAKGGVLIEKDATDDMKEFEKTWSRPDKPTYVPRGFLGQYPKVVPKPVGAMPPVLFQLLEFALSSVRDTTGISQETLGMREADQPASLEYQRRQAGMLILQPLLKNLKRYIREQGKVMLYLIQKYLSDGRLVRIVGEQGAQYVKLALQADVKYDIIVDDAPTSPNQKEQVWSMVGERFWELPPSIQTVLLEYSPFPTSVVEKVKEAAKQEQASSAEIQQQMLMLEAKLKEVEIQLKGAQAGKTQAETQQIMSETGPDPQAQHQHDMHKLQTESALKAADQQATHGLKRESIYINAGLQREKQAQDGQLGMTKIMADTRTKQRANEMNAAVAAQKAKMQSKAKPAGRAA